MVQQCGAGLVPVRRTADGLAFAAPPLLRSGPVEESLTQHIASVLRIDRAEILDAEWADNGPGWAAVLLASAETVLALRPGFVDLDLGVVGPYPPGSPQSFEVRAFFPKDGATVEDPVTGSLNASLAQWLLRTGRASAPYVASQGTALGRSGRTSPPIPTARSGWAAARSPACAARSSCRRARLCALRRARRPRPQFVPPVAGNELGMDGQLDGQAVARALRGRPDAAPMPGDLPAVLQQLVDTTKTVLATDGVGLMLTDADGRLGSAVSTDAVAELLEQVQADFGEGPCLTAYSSGEPLAVTDLGADPRWIRLAAVVGQVSVRAMAAVPVRLAGVVVGSLSAYTTTARA